MRLPVQALRLLQLPKIQSYRGEAYWESDPFTHSERPAEMTTAQQSAFNAMRDALIELDAEWRGFNQDQYGLQGEESNAFYTLPSVAKALAEPQARCTYCDGTGDVHTPTGEWHGQCSCEAGKPNTPDCYAQAAISLNDAWLHYTGAEPSESVLARAIDQAATLLLQVGRPQVQGEFDIRGVLAAKLTCWHRLTETEDAELVSLFASQPQAQGGHKPLKVEFTKEWCLAAAELEVGHDVTVGNPASQPSIDKIEQARKGCGDCPYQNCNYPNCLIKATPPASAQAGYKLVPVEPTPEMTQAAMTAWMTRRPFVEVYSSLLAAAPEATK
jgi:hypothetical protein